MGATGIITLLLIFINIYVSVRGFSRTDFFARYSFEIERVRYYKEYYRLFSSGFLHVNYLHLGLNMVTLYFFSGGVEAYFGGALFLLIYLVSLACGNLFAMLVYRNSGDYSAVGASGAVAGIIFAAIAVFPGMRIGLFFVPIPGWMFGLGYVLLSIYGIRSRRNNIGHEAHLGGALAGMLLAVLLNPSAIVNNYLPILLVTVPSAVFIYIIIKHPGYLLVDNYFFKKHRHYNVDERYNAEKLDKQKEVDRILEKINKKGMNSLTKKERETLDNY